MIAVGDQVPDIELRTDEGTPLYLSDLRGRALALFLLGEGFSHTAERLLLVLAQEIEGFYDIGCSPVAVLGEPPERLAAFREQHDVPYIMISDRDCALQTTLMGERGKAGGALIANRLGIVVDIVPALPPSELIRLTLIGVNRTISIPADKEPD